MLFFFGQGGFLLSGSFECLVAFDVACASLFWEFTPFLRIVLRMKVLRFEQSAAAEALDDASVDGSVNMQISLLAVLGDSDELEV